MFVLARQKQFVKTDTRHKNLIAVLNRKHPSTELLRFKNFIHKEKCEYSQNEYCKRNTINKKNFSRKFKKCKIYFGPLVLAALKGYCGDNGYKMQTSFKTFV